jgi:hypothetical protein
LDRAVGFIGLLGQTIVLGIAAAFTPSLLLLQVLIVSGDPWRRRSLAVATGGAAAFGIVGTLLLLGFAKLPDVASGHVDSAGAWLRVVAGVVLAVVAVILFRPHPGLRERMESDIRGYVAHASSWVFLGIAFALSIKDVSSFVVMAPAMHDIAVADIDIVLQAVLIIVFYALALSPVLVPPALRLFFGHRVDAFFRAVYGFTLTHQLQLVGGMAAVMAAYLLTTGIARLV